ncbi:hypothetical protein CQA66_08455 [Helicobacter aurati]|uniref:Baseplate protein J-like barrel domain-containing protein n=1 Tax=Helicobacter aurati TaxID=137778 RepID=A0A3D8IZP7_9HELI|nr:baseplate J/gp47 family protein [Helicobacter aurati]RDU70430.1 hypothetical protein CQA66_08455 [Helicobacter aurati]
MSSEYPLLKMTNEGLKYSDTDEILKDVKAAFKVAFPNLNVDSVDTPQGQIIAYFTEKIVECSNAILENVNSNFNGGFDFTEDINAKTFFGVSRKPASACVVKATITGKPNTIIPANFKALSGDLEFINSTGETRIDSLGLKEIEMTCLKKGEYQILAGTLTTILTPQYGIETITNKADSTKGNDIEQGLWGRALRSQFNRALSLFESYISNVNNVAGVTDCVGYDNSTNINVTYKNQVFTPHTVGVVVEGGDAKEIAEALYAVRNPGPAMLGDVEVLINGKYDNQKYIIKFSRPIYFNLRCKMIVSVGHMANENYEESLKNQIIEIIKKNKINQTIFTDSKALQIELPYHVDLVVLKLQRLTIDNITDDIENQDIIQLDFKEKAVLEYKDIEIEKYVENAKKT